MFHFFKGFRGAFISIIGGFFFIKKKSLRVTDVNCLLCSIIHFVITSCIIMMDFESSRKKINKK